MPKATPASSRSKAPGILQGTLDMMILRTLAIGTNHGYGIARRIRDRSNDVLNVEEGSLYPALHRMEKRGLIEACWKQSESNRRAKYYTLTAQGRRQLKHDTATWNSLSQAVGNVMGATRLTLLSALPDARA